MFEFLSEKITSIFDRLKGEKKLTSDVIKTLLDDLKSVLLDADVPLKAAESLLTNVEQKCVGLQLRGGITAQEMVTKQVYDSLVSFLGGSSTSSQDFLTTRLSRAKKRSGPHVILVAGLQGAGKTTTLSKLVSRLITQESRINAKIAEHILVTSVDYTRPAARDQLKILIQKLGAHFFDEKSSDAIQAVNDVLNYAKQKSYKYLFIDTAGRLHVDVHLLAELKKIAEISQPSVTFLVLDGMMGQSALSVAQEFGAILPFDGAIITKLDSGSRAGAAFSFSFVTKKPVVYIGVGEKAEELEPFHADRIAKRLLGMGDLVTLVENANQKIAKNEEEMIQKAMKRGDISIDGYVSVLDILGRMGSFKKLFSMMPRSLFSSAISDEQIDKLETDSKMFRVMSLSMTKKERLKPVLLHNSSRQIRIARGSGISVQDIRRLVDQYNQLKEQMKSLGKMGRFFV